MQYFLYLFSVKIGLKISFNNGLDRKETFLFVEKEKFSKTQKSDFSKPMLLIKKCNIFYFFSVKIGLEIRFNNVLDRKQTFIFVQKQNFSKSQKSHFFKGINPCFWSTNSISIEIRCNNVLERKESFFDYKNKIFLRLENRNFPKGLTHAFDQKIKIFLFICFWSKQDWK